MQSSELGRHRCNLVKSSNLKTLLTIAIATSVVGPAVQIQAAGASTNAPAAGKANSTNSVPGSLTSTTDPVLSLLLEKGMITEDEAEKTQAQADALRTNMAAEYAAEGTKWRFAPSIKDIELYGDFRVRYEGRSEEDPSGGRINDDRFRYAVRLGLRGDVYDDFYYGVRLETSSNPRSTWVTMGSSSPDPYGKSAAGINIGQVYLGWKPESWFDFTVGKMPNPLYTSSLLWSSSINPEGLAERLNYTLGAMDVFANFAQFLYQDGNPDDASKNLGIGTYDSGQNANSIVQVAWEAGLNYHITKDLSVKAAATVYKYYGMQRSTSTQALSPYFGDAYVGEGAYYSAAKNAPVVNGYSGYSSGTTYGYTANGSTNTFYNSLGYPNNQVGLDYLTVLEFPFEINYRFRTVDTRLFGDFAYNLQGAERARAAQAGYAAYVAYESTENNVKPITVFSAQTHDVKAYQFGLAVADKDCVGLVNGSVSKKHGWELRTYWQHIEQYSLDPNLLDLDYMAGAENLEGIYAAAAYGFSDNFIGTFRYGYASRINHVLGTGGTGTDIPQINPINYYQLFQVDLTYKF
jgi:hypothetical protein